MTKLQDVKTIEITEGKYDTYKVTIEDANGTHEVTYCYMEIVEGLNQVRAVAADNPKSFASLPQVNTPEDYINHYKVPVLLREGIPGPIVRLATVRDEGYIQSRYIQLLERKLREYQKNNQ